MTFSEYAITYVKIFNNSTETVRNREEICLKMGKRDRLGYFIHGHGVWGFFEKVKRRTHKQEADPASDGFQTQNEPEPLQQSRIGVAKVHIL